MKSKTLFSSSWSTVAQGWWLVVALFACSPANAQNFVRNPDFEQEIGPDNWTVEYAAVTGGNIAAANRPTNSCPNDFLIKGRTCISHKNKVAPYSDAWDGHPNYWNKMGAHFMPNHTWGAHAYFKQVVTNLAPGSNYMVSAWMAMFGRTDKTDVYLEAIGGLGSRRTANVTVSVQGSGQYTNWHSYAVTNTADANGQIEVRLHMNKNYTIANWSYREINAFFDHVAVVPVWQPPYQPSFKLLSSTISGPDVTLTWETVRNNRYRIQVSTDCSNPLSWVNLVGDPYVDPDFQAIGTNMTFTTNLFANDPAYDPTVPHYFRIVASPFVP